MNNSFSSAEFGNDFYWGVAIAAQQNEGGRSEGGRSDSIWDHFAGQKGKIKNVDKIGDACDFYHRYREDIALTKLLGFNSFRFSLSWSRILPDESGNVNQEGIRFYQNVIQECLSVGLTPFVTLYHWDLPQALELKGGWASPLMPLWFRHFTKVCARAFGKDVKHWLVLNEPMGFTSLGYLLGKHAPGRRSVKDFFAAVHNALMAQGIGGQLLRQYVPDAQIGTTFSCSEVIPYRRESQDIEAAKRVDVLMNRLFVEPLLGLGYPHLPGFKFIEKMELYNLAWRYREQVRFDFDFIGLQNYFPIVVKHNPLIPYIQASEVSPKERGANYTALGWEINSGSFGNIVRQFAKYENMPRLMITENGAAFKDIITGGNRINDDRRIHYFETHLKELLSLKAVGLPIDGYFAWTLMDNFEWAFGYQPKFGLVAVNRNTQQRTIKKSGYWFQSFLKG